MRSSRLVAWVAILVLSPVLVSCTDGGVASTGSEAATSISPGSPAATIAVTSEPSIDVPPSHAASAEPPLPEPPAASIAVEGGDPVVGELGAFDWNNTGSASPGLDGAPIHVGVGETMTMALSEPAAIASWQVSRVLPGNHDRVGAIAMGQGSGQRVAFQAPPAGTWSVEVRVGFAGDVGSAAYYWSVEVD